MASFWNRDHQSFKGSKGDINNFSSWWDQEWFWKIGCHFFFRLQFGRLKRDWSFPDTKMPVLRWKFSLQCFRPLNKLLFNYNFGVFGKLITWFSGPSWVSQKINFGHARHSQTKKTEILSWSSLQINLPDILSFAQNFSANILHKNYLINRSYHYYYARLHRILHNISVKVV